jgi:hypothetical protein
MPDGISVGHSFLAARLSLPRQCPGGSEGLRKMTTRWSCRPGDPKIGLEDGGYCRARLMEMCRLCRFYRVFQVQHIGP